MFDVKDITMGFWIGAGIFLFTILASLLSGIAGKALSRG